MVPRHPSQSKGQGVTPCATHTRKETYLIQMLRATCTMWEEYCSYPLAGDMEDCQFWERDRTRESSMAHSGCNTGALLLGPYGLADPKIIRTLSDVPGKLLQEHGGSDHWGSGTRPYRLHKRTICHSRRSSGSLLYSARNGVSDQGTS
jgi:hypothetical protein